MNQPIPTTPDSLLTVDQLAAFLNVSAKTIYHWVLRREIPYTKVGRLLRFDPNEVVAHFKKQTEAKATSCPSIVSLVESRHRSLKTRGNFVAGNRSLQCQ